MRARTGTVIVGIDSSAGKRNACIPFIRVADCGCYILILIHKHTSSCIYSSILLLRTYLTIKSPSRYKIFFMNKCICKRLQLKLFLNDPSILLQKCSFLKFQSTRLTNISSPSIPLNRDCFVVAIGGVSVRQIYNSPSITVNAFAIRRDLNHDTLP